MLDEFNYTIWKPKKDSKPRFVSLEDLPSIGYQGVYNIRESDARGLEIHGIESFKGVVHSKYLWVDCDTDEAVLDTIDRLIKLDLHFVQYTTGNRGAHFELARDSEPSHLLPQWDRLWVKTFLPMADLSLYTHMHLIRVEGATHEKTGLKKKCVDLKDGNGLMFPEDLPTEVSTQKIVSETKGSLQCVFDDAYLMARTTPNTEGNRHKMFCSVAARLYDLGQSLEFTLGWLHNLNLMTEPPLPTKDIERMAEWAFSKN